MASVHRLVRFVCPACQDSSTGLFEDTLIGELWYCSQCSAYLEVRADGVQVEIPSRAMPIEDALMQQVYRKRYCPCVLKALGLSATSIALAYLMQYGTIREHNAPACIIGPLEDS
jgi:hypothetical protein